MRRREFIIGAAASASPLVTFVAQSAETSRTARGLRWPSMRSARATLILPEWDRATRSILDGVQS